MSVFQSPLCRRLLSAAILLFVCSCDKDDAQSPKLPEITKLVTVKVAASYVTDNSDNWVIIQNADGKNLEHKSFESNQEFTLETEKEVIGETITVTILSLKTVAGKKNYQLESYTQYPIGDEINLKTRAIASAPPVADGSVTVKFTDMSKAFTPQFSNKLGALNGYYSVEQDQYTVAHHSTAGRCLVTVRNLVEDTFKYTFFDAKKGETYSFDFNTLTPTEHITKFDNSNFPKNASGDLLVEGREAQQSLLDPGYVIDKMHISEYNEVKTIKAAHPSALTKFTTTFDADNTAVKYHYLNRGNLPATEITWPAYGDFYLPATSRPHRIQSLQTATKHSFKKRVSQFTLEQYDDGHTVNWFVESPTSNHAIGNLPDELLALHPQLYLSKMYYFKTTYYLEGPDTRDPGKFMDLENVVIKTITVGD